MGTTKFVKYEKTLNMKIEFEAKFYPIIKDLVRQKLQGVGAILDQQEFRMRRITYDLGKSKWLRIRDERSKTSITIKEIINEHSIEGVKECEILANDFQKSCDLFENLGFKPTSYQENDREIWHLDNGMITIDTWPGLEPILEIEGESSAHVITLAKKLNLDFNEALFGTVNQMYSKKYNISQTYFNNIPYLSFENVDQIFKRSKVNFF